MSTVATRPHRPINWHSWWVVVAGTYLLLLLVSTCIRATKKPTAFPTDIRMLEVHAVSGERLLDSAVQLAYRELGSDDKQHPPVIVLHGSPGQSRELDGLSTHLSERYRLIVPDLPGFGHSAHSIPDYSMRAHAQYARQLLDRLARLRARGYRDQVPAP